MIIRDISYTDNGRTVPARQFYVERGGDHYSVTVADFTNMGPAIDDEVANALRVNQLPALGVCSQFRHQVSAKAGQQVTTQPVSRVRCHHDAIVARGHAVYVGLCLAEWMVLARIVFAQ